MAVITGGFHLIILTSGNSDHYYSRYFDAERTARVYRSLINSGVEITLRFDEIQVRLLWYVSGSMKYPRY